MSERDVLRSSAALLQGASGELERFLVTWRERTALEEELYGELLKMSKEMKGSLGERIKASRTYREWMEAFGEVKELLAVSRKLYDIASGPLVLVKLMGEVAKLAEQTSRLVDRVGAEQVEEGSILDRLTPDQLLQVYEWIASNEAVRK